MQLREQNDLEPLGEPHRYEALLEMADLMVRHHSLPELFHDIAVRLRKVANFQFLNFSLHDAEDDLMHLHWWKGEFTANLPARLPVSESPSGWVREHQEELLFSDSESERRFPAVLGPLRTNGIRTYYVVPLTTAQSRWGALVWPHPNAMPIRRQTRRYSVEWQSWRR